MTVYYVDLESGNNGNSGLSFAQRKLTIDSAAAAMSAGDTCRIMASPTPTSLGQSVQWTDLSAALTLTTAVTATICLCESSWTLQNTATVSTTATCKEGSAAATITLPASPAINTIYAYFATGTIDLSGYKQVSFWIKNTGAVIANNLALKLCSDTAGATPVNTIAIPAIPSTGQFVCITVDTGGALGSSIKSIALYTGSDVTGIGSKVITLDCIIACKDSTSADSLTLSSLIGKNTAGEYWWPIASIVGTTVTLDNDVAATPSQLRGYVGSTESVTTYKRECVNPTMVAAVGTAVYTISQSGTAGNQLTFSGGWDRTAMTTQSGETWLTMRNGFGAALSVSGSYVSLDHIGAVRAGTGFAVAGSGITGFAIDVCHAVGATSNGFSITQSGTATAGNSIGTIDAMANGNGAAITIGSLPRLTCTSLVAHSSRASGIGGFSAQQAVVTSMAANNNGTSGVTLNSGSTGCVVASVSARNNVTLGLVYSSALSSVVTLGTLTANATANVQAATSGGRLLGGTLSGSPVGILATAFTRLYAKDLTTTDTTPVSLPSLFGALVSIENYGGVAGDSRAYGSDYTIVSTTAVRHTASGRAWKLSPTSANITSAFPAPLPLGRVRLTANVAANLNVWVRRDNIGLTAKLVCKGGQLAGIAADVTATAAAAVDTWEKLTITVTPTEDGVIEIEVQAYGGTTYSVYVDDLSLS